MPKAGRRQQKNPRESKSDSPQKQREPMKQAKAEKPPKKSLYDLCQERKHELHDAKREKDDAAKAALFRQQEDEIMAMTYGPNWRQKQLPGDPPKTKLAAPAEPFLDDDDDVEYDDYPDSGDSRVRLRAS